MVSKLGDSYAESIAHSQAMEAMKDQLIIVLVNRLGGTVKVPVNEIDDTGQYLMMLQLDQDDRTFTFSVRKKQ